VLLAGLATINTSYALNEPLRYKVGPEFDRAVISECISWGTVGEAMADFANVRQGRFPSYPLTMGVDPTHRDPTRAPAGKGLVYNTALVPYHLADGGAARWDEIKEEVADMNLAYLRRFTLNFTDENILARHIETPLDMERWSPSFKGGDIHGVAANFFQMVGHRPTPDLGQYTVPGIERLYLAGPFQHPGGGVQGGGRATAMVILDDLGIDFESVTGDSQ